MMHRMECDKCEEEKRNVHATGYERSADAKAGDGMTVLAYFCEECIEEIFDDHVEWYEDAISPRTKH